tara:strand:+ start:58 stop:498 length:441 start_codon:yes stop_codon:yes gene_type:complete
MEIFKNLFSIFNNEEDTSIKNTNPFIIALFVRAAKVDGTFHKKEKDFIILLIERYFLIKNDEAINLLREAENIEKNTSDTVQITKVIKDQIPYEDRIELIEDLWTVVLSDEKREAEEDSFMRLCVKLLGINDKDSALARKKVQSNI